ncbi:MAG: ABC transporter permease, partial [Ilumatobacteraceae bacterium]
MSLLDLKVRRDIGRQKWQFIAVIVTVVLGVSLFAGSFNAYLNLGDSLDGSYDRLNMADVTVLGVEASFADEATAIDGVADAIARRQADVPFTIGDTSLLGRVAGVPADGQPAINMLDIEEGGWLDPGVPSGVLLEEHAASDFELGVGDTFEIVGTEVEVVGVVVSTEYLWPARDAQNVFTPPESFAVVFADDAVFDVAAGAAITEQVLVLYDDGVDVGAVDDAVTAAAESAGAAGVQLLADQPSDAIIRTEIDALQAIAVALPFLFLA